MHDVAVIAWSDVVAPAAGALLTGAAALPAALLGAPGWIVLPMGVAGACVAVVGRRVRALTAEVAKADRAAHERADQLAAASHDLRSPLAMVSAAAELLLTEGPGPLTPTQQRFLRTVVDQSAHAVQIADDNLVQARLEAGAYELRRTMTDLSALVRETVTGLRPLAQRRDQHIITQLPAVPVRALVDAPLLRRAVVNLATNAMRFTTYGGLIVLRVLDNETSVVICVTDDGIGMSREERERLFRPFVSGSTLGDGTGLGLVLTRRIAEAHGGRILVDTSPRRGTTMMLRLPRERA
ncbi:Signal transduction histidine kinase [Pseudonocardia thermophila]|uniref:histidine kinase n=1 Tax=Pseudonocardia thermophila TaxID=1848 RepID=A0A1M6ZV09_PSETH|nr:Signal transduction histidine kinase [Pseudonocardia thermophila]